MACKRYDGQSILFSARSDCSWVFKAEDYTEDWETRYMQTRYSYSGVHKKKRDSLEVDILGTTSCQRLVKHLHCNQTAMMSTCICYAS